jgi:hypothetical protein
MLRMRDSSPLEARIEIPRHTRHQVAGQLHQVDLAFIAGQLPLVETSRDVDSALGGVKPGLNGTVLARALTAM